MMILNTARHFFGMRRLPIGSRLFRSLLFMASRPGTALLALALLLLSCTQAAGGIYYVDAENGDDGYDGLAPVYEGGNTGPWKSVSKVNDTYFLPGDSILFKRGGVWTDGPLTPRNGGAPGGMITIQDTVIDQPLSFNLVDPDNHQCIYFGDYGDSPEKPRIDCREDRGIVLLHDYIIVKNLHLDNGDNNVLWLAAEDGASWIIIDSVDVTNSIANAVRVTNGGGNIWLKGLYVYDYGVNGILLNGSENHKLRAVLVEDCWVENPETLELEDAITCHRDENENDLAGYIIIRNNTTLRAGEDGIDITSGSNILLEGNHTSFSHAGGIYVNYQWVNTVEIRGNFIYSNSVSQGYGDLTIRSPRVRAVNNIVAGTGHHCVLVSDTDDTQLWNNVIAPENRTGNFIRLRDGIGRVEFRNNIFDLSRTGQDINGEASPNIVFDNNCYYGTSIEQPIFGSLSFEEMRAENPQFEPHGMWANPRFFHPALNHPDHFKILRSSPCRDAGASLPLDTDFWGTSRPQDGRVDIGVYERGAKLIPGSSEISARAWRDNDKDCKRDGDETGIAGVLVNLYDARGGLLAVTRSGADGSFRFAGIPAGDYRVEADPSNFAPGKPLEDMAMACSSDGSTLSFTVSAAPDARTEGNGLGFAADAAASIELLSFEASMGQGAAQLSWSTSAKSRASRFEIERSNDGLRFYTKGHVKALPAEGGRNPSYHLADDDGLTGKLIFYRLKMVDEAGRITYSEIRPAQMEDDKPAAIKAFPNPFSDKLNLSLEEGAGIYKLWMVDAHGRAVLEKQIKDSGRELSFQLGHLPKGPYYLIIRPDKDSKEQMALPLIKQ